MASCDLQMSNFHLSLSVKEGGSLVWERRIKIMQPMQIVIYYCLGVRSYMLSLSIPSVREGGQEGKDKAIKVIGSIDLWWCLLACKDNISPNKRKKGKTQNFLLARYQRSKNKNHAIWFGCWGLQILIANRTYKT